MYNGFFCIYLGTLLNVQLEGLRIFIDIMLSCLRTLWKCLWIVSPECWNLSWTNLLHAPCPSIVKHIPTDSSSLICLVCWSPYLCCKTLHNWRKTCGFILSISCNFASLPINNPSTTYRKFDQNLYKVVYQCISYNMSLLHDIQQQEDHIIHYHLPTTRRSYHSLSSSLLSI